MRKRSILASHVVLFLGMALVALPMAACGSGSDGAPGEPGKSTGTLTGMVTNYMTGAPLGGASIDLDPSVPGVTLTTNSSGVYSATLPVGFYNLTASYSGFVDGAGGASVTAGGTTTKNFALDPEDAVKVSISGAPSSPNPGDTFTLNATATPYDGSTVLGYQWTQTHSVPTIINSPTAASTAVTLGTAAQYKAALHDMLLLERTEKGGTLADGAEHHYLDKRWGIVPMTPYAIEEGGLVTLECAVTTTSGVHTASVDIHAHMPFATWSTGLQNVPTGLPVMLNSVAQATYDWFVLTQPPGSSITLFDATSPHPYFIPVIAGMYEIQVTDLALGPQVIEIWAGPWVGAISNIGTDGLPDAASCTACHNDVIAPDKFTDWRQSGHAHIFTNNVNTGGHYSASCFPCHTVGYNTDAVNNGMDDQSDYAAMMAGMFAGGFSHPDPGNWATVVSTWPNSAKMANIQCEHCHGPNGGAHTEGAIRVSFSSDVCGFCHGEPPRHGRFQQWALSGHGNYHLALEEATVESRGGFANHCGRCHSGQGFYHWLKGGDLTQRIQGSSGNATVAELTAMGLTNNTVHSQSCAACHKVHNVGTMSGANNNAIMRLDGDAGMLPAGFMANNLGKGALCIACHNSRNGVHNDNAGPTTLDDRAPHTSCQGDVLMGENAYFVTTGVRGSHALIADACVTCHVEITDPPDYLSYNLSGTNHSFLADHDICTACHGDFDGGTLHDATEDALHDLEHDIWHAIEAEIAFHLLTDTFTVTWHARDPAETTGVIVLTAADTYSVVELIEWHGRASMSLMVNGVTYTDIRMNSDMDLGGGGSLLVNSVAGNQGQMLAKALWNYWLLHGDGSHGIHNPAWTAEVIYQTGLVVNALWP